MTSIDAPLPVPVAQVGPAVGEIPRYAHDGDAGADLFSAEHAFIGPHNRAIILTGVAVAIPHGYVGLIWPRSGLAVRHGIHVLGGVIDSNYRGEIGVVLLNTDEARPFEVSPGDRIAQMVFQKVERAMFGLMPYQFLNPTDRAEAGFGSTGR